MYSIECFAVGVLVFVDRQQNKVAGSTVLYSLTELCVSQYNALYVVFKYSELLHLWISPLYRADGIVQLLGSYEDGNQALAVLEDCTGGTLIGHMANKGGRLDEDSCVKNVVRPLLQALAWVHSHAIVLR